MRPRLFFSVVVLLLAFALRLADLYRQPVFSDEGVNILWAQNFARGSSDYPLLMDGRFLFGVTLAGMGVEGPAPLWLGRATGALSGALGCAAAIALARALGLRRAALLAGLVYACLPYAVFHDRQALTDPVMGSVGALVCVFTLRAWRRPRLHAGLAVGAGLSLSAAFLFKPTGLIYALMPAAAVGTGGRERRRLFWHGALTLAVGGLITAAFLAVFWTRLGQNDGNMLNQRIGFVGCPPLLCAGDWAGQAAQWERIAPTVPEVLSAYFGWPALTLAVLAAGLIQRDRRRPALALLLFVLGSLLVFIVAAKAGLPPRYLSPLAAPLAALSAVGVAGLARRANALGPVVRVAAAAAAFSLTLWPMTANSLSIIAAPERAFLPAFDRLQYVDGPFAGVGLAEAAQAVLAENRGAPRPPLVILRHPQFSSVTAYFDPRQAGVVNAWEVRWPDVETRWSLGLPVYFLDEVPAGWTGAAGEVRVYPRVNGTALARLQRFTGAGADDRLRLYELVFKRPDEVRSDYDALAAWARAASPVTLLAYPPHQQPVLQEALAGAPDVAVADLAGEAPWQPETLSPRLEAAAAGPKIAAVFLDETRLDPGRQVEAWLNTHLFRERETWFGAVRVVTYAPGGPVSLSLTVDARWEEVVTLERVEVLDAALAPGGRLRLRLIWRADGPTGRASKIFIHLFNDAGLAAQYDGQPVGELRPTNTWRAGEQIMDQVALSLPADLPPGPYQLRIGLYDLETQARLPARLADGEAAEFWIGGDLAGPPPVSGP